MLKKRIITGIVLPSHDNDEEPPIINYYENDILETDEYFKLLDKFLFFMETEEDFEKRNSGWHPELQKQISNYYEIRRYDYDKVCETYKARVSINKDFPNHLDRFVNEKTNTKREFWFRLISSLFAEKFPGLIKSTAHNKHASTEVSFLSYILKSGSIYIIDGTTLLQILSISSIFDEILKEFKIPLSPAKSRDSDNLIRIARPCYRFFDWVIHPSEKNKKALSSPYMSIENLSTAKKNMLFEITLILYCIISILIVKLKKTFKDEQKYIGQINLLKQFMGIYHKNYIQALVCAYMPYKIRKGDEDNYNYDLLDFERKISKLLKDKYEKKYTNPNIPQLPKINTIFTSMIKTLRKKYTENSKVQSPGENILELESSENDETDKNYYKKRHRINYNAFNNKEEYTYKKAIDLLGISLRQLYRLIKKNNITPEKRPYRDSLYAKAQRKILAPTQIEKIKASLRKEHLGRKIRISDICNELLPAKIKIPKNIRKNKNKWLKKILKKQQLLKNKDEYGYYFTPSEKKMVLKFFKNRHNLTKGIVFYNREY